MLEKVWLKKNQRAIFSEKFSLSNAVTFITRAEMSFLKMVPPRTSAGVILALNESNDGVVGFHQKLHQKHKEMAYRGWRNTINPSDFHFADNISATWLVKRY